MPYVGNMNTTFTTLTSSDANITDDLTVTDDASIGGTLGVTGVVTANAGVVVDNITIDGTEIDLSSGDLTLDVASDIILDSDAANWRFKDAGTSILEIGSGGTEVHHLYIVLFQMQIWYLKAMMVVQQLQP